MIAKNIEKLVEAKCREKTNFYGYRAWSHHIKSVVDSARLLAKKVGADEEIVEIAALLHDVASVSNKDWYEEHHIHSARLAEKILNEYDYSKDKIERVKHCILAHRGSRKIKRETLEAEVVASADSMAHFDNVNSLLELALVIYKMDTDEGTRWVLDKLERSWQKLMPEAKEILADKYAAIKLTFENSTR